MQISMCRWVARRLLRSSEAARGPLVLPQGDPIVSIGRDDPCRVLLVGSGLAAGVGVLEHGQALTGAIARSVSERSGRGASVESRGSAHSFLSDVPVLLASVPREPSNAVVVTAGMMEAIGMTSNRTWERWLLAVLEMVQSRFGTEVAVVLVGMPAPSGAVLEGAGRRARFVDRRAEGLNSVSQRMVAKPPRWWFVPLQQAEHMRGQPTPAAYAGWAAQLGEAVTATAATKR